MQLAVHIPHTLSVGPRFRWATVTMQLAINPPLTCATCSFYSRAIFSVQLIVAIPQAVAYVVNVNSILHTLYLNRKKVMA
jgi:hypothetical protein